MQLFWIRSLVFLYLTFFLWLSGQVVVESYNTDGWTSDDIPDHSVLVGITALSGWFTNVLSLINFVLGFGGGLFNRPANTETVYTRGARIFLLLWCAALILISLWALWSVASASDNIAENISSLGRLMGDEVSTKPAIEALGLLNTSIIAGFLIGLAIPDVPKIK